MSGLQTYFCHVCTWGYLIGLPVAHENSPKRSELNLNALVTVRYRTLRGIDQLPRLLKDAVRTIAVTVRYMSRDGEKFIETAMASARVLEQAKDRCHDANL